MCGIQLMSIIDIRRVRGQQYMNAKKLMDKEIEQARKNASEYHEYMTTVDVEYFIDNKRAM